MIRIRQFQCPSGLKGGSATDRLLGLRVRMLPEAWMFVLCVVSKDKKAKRMIIKTKKKVRIKYK